MNNSNLPQSLTNVNSTPSQQPAKQYKSSIITINTTNYVGNATYRYRIPSSIRFKQGDRVMLSSLSIYNSTFNITQAYNNNKFSFYFPPKSQWYTITIPDGYYSIEELNLLFQFECTKLNLYARKGTNIIYFARFSVNKNQYKAQIDTYTVPNATEATTLGYTIDIPTSTGVQWSFTSTTRSTQINLSINLGKILGFTTRIVNNETFNPLIANQTYLSDIYASLSPITDYLVTCNLLHSDFNIHPQILTQIPIDSSFGTRIVYTGSSDSALSIQPSSYSEIMIQLLTQDYQLLPMNDPEITLSLIIISEI